MNDIIEDAMELIGPGRICEVNAENVFLLVNALKILTERHEAFRQEVSDAVEMLLDRFLGDSLSQGVICGFLLGFVIRKPDPLVEAMNEWQSDPVRDDDYTRFRAALAKRGLEIREKK